MSSLLILFSASSADTHASSSAGLAVGSARQPSRPFSSTSLPNAPASAPRSAAKITSLDTSRSEQPTGIVAVRSSGEVVTSSHFGAPAGAATTSPWDGFPAAPASTSTAGKVVPAKRSSPTVCRHSASGADARPSASPSASPPRPNQQSPGRPPLRKKPRPSEDSGYGTREDALDLSGGGGGKEDVEFEVAESDHGDGAGPLLEGVDAADTGFADVRVEAERAATGTGTLGAAIGSVAAAVVAGRPAGEAAPPAVGSSGVAGSDVSLSLSLIRAASELTSWCKLPIWQDLASLEAELVARTRRRGDILKQLLECARTGNAWTADDISADELRQN